MADGDNLILPPGLVTEPGPGPQPQGEGEREDRTKVASGDPLTVIDAVRQFKREAEDAKTTRSDKSELNRQMDLRPSGPRGATPGPGTGQARSYVELPSVTMATEQISAFVKSALTDVGQWFTPQIRPGGTTAPLTTHQIQAWLQSALDESGPDQAPTFATTMADGIKTGVIESLVVLKVHGIYETRREWTVEAGVRPVTIMGADGTPLTVPAPTQVLQQSTRPRWRLKIDLVPTRDYFPDPTGRGLYEIHTVYRDLADVVQMAELGIYDGAAVARLVDKTAAAQDEWERARERNQDVSQAPGFRPTVEIDEFWGTLLDSDGLVAQENIVCAVADETELIRPPEPNPYWHGRRPFVAFPLMRVPFSVWHRAIMDHARPLAEWMDALFSLMTDGAISSVWGNRQVRPGLLEDPKSITNGIAPGQTLVLRDEAPLGAKVLEQVVAGAVPQEAAAMYAQLDREFQMSTFINDIKLGQLPRKQATATEIQQSEAASGTFFGAMVRDIEDTGIEPVLERAWNCLLQHVDDMAASEIVGAIGVPSAVQLLRMTPAQRFAAFGPPVTFKVDGLSAMQKRAQEFQKFMALLQAVSGNPLLAQAFFTRYSPQKIIGHMFRSLSIDPALLESGPEEMKQMMGQVQAPGGVAPGQAMTSAVQAAGAGAPPGVGAPGMAPRMPVDMLGARRPAQPRGAPAPMRPPAPFPGPRPPMTGGAPGP
jgi:hypothetical protein